ncbi:MAG: recombination protein NinG [Tenuifilaceae bacterium]|jgi:hypothetical protein|nr:recombination protein NinG [Tenuifilaceae bacterium]
MNKSTINRLDRVFSEFIRLRDANANGYVRCISCGKIDHWKEVDCGHYVNRKHLSTRWHEKNCNAQCRACNRFDEGNMLGYTKGLVNKYGPSVLDELDVLKHQVSKLNDFDGGLLLKHYQDRVKELKKQKAA